MGHQKYQAEQPIVSLSQVDMPATTFVVSGVAGPDKASVFDFPPLPRTAYAPLSNFLFFFTFVIDPRRSLSLKLSDARVNGPQIRARLVTTAHFCDVRPFSAPHCVCHPPSKPRTLNPEAPGSRNRCSGFTVHDARFSLQGSGFRPRSSASLLCPALRTSPFQTSSSYLLSL